MTTLDNVESVIARLELLREDIARREDELRTADPRFEDVVWPCIRYEQIKSAAFESASACLVAEESTLTLWLSFPILTDLITQLPEELRGPATDWFFLHQLVHVSQGLSYFDFRTLNRAGNRHETMRADCEADFISLKAIALLSNLSDQHSTISRFSELLDKMLPSMVQMEPNLFIPRRRDIEVLRIFALLVLRHYFAIAAETGQPAPNTSLFPWWSTDYTELYIFMGQVNTLGRGRIEIEPDYLRRILDCIRAGNHKGAYDLVTTFRWPTLDGDSLPSRLTMS